MKKILLIFIISFLLNFIWENLHSFLYDNYMGGEITNLVLLHATLGDATMVTLFALPFVFLNFFKKNNWIIIPIFLIIAVAIEWYAVAVGRWEYNSFMPIIPFVNVGLTPAIQLSLLGFMTLKIQKYFSTHHE